MIIVKDLHKTYENDKQVLTLVLKGISLEIKSGEFVAIMGRSGAGKSTLMYQMGILDRPTSGSIYIDNVEITTLPQEERVDFRLNKLGYVFQDYALLPDLTSLENVALPLLMQNKDKKVAYREAKEVLERVGLGHRLDNLPSQLSGGEQQRVSIARAIGHKPKILFADEPTANLDNQSSKQVLEIFRSLNKTIGQTIVMVTHEQEYGDMADRIIRLDDGRVMI